MNVEYSKNILQVFVIVAPPRQGLTDSRSEGSLRVYDYCFPKLGDTQRLPESDRPKPALTAERTAMYVTTAIFRRVNTFERNPRFFARQSPQWRVHTYRALSRRSRPVFYPAVSVIWHSIT